MGSQKYHLFSVWTNGVVQINLAYAKNKPLFALPERRLTILRQLNAIDGIDLPEDAIDRMPSFSVAVLHDAAKREQFLAVFEGMIAQIRES
jgi:hypothetical protein